MLDVGPTNHFVPPTSLARVSSIWCDTIDLIDSPPRAVLQLGTLAGFFRAPSVLKAGSQSAFIRSCSPCFYVLVLPELPACPTAGAPFDPPVV